MEKSTWREQALEAAVRAAEKTANECWPGSEGHSDIMMLCDQIKNSASPSVPKQAGDDIYREGVEDGKSLIKRTEFDCPKCNERIALSVVEDLPLLVCGKYRLTQGPAEMLLITDPEDGTSFVITEVNISAFMFTGMMLLADLDEKGEIDSHPVD